MVLQPMVAVKVLGLLAAVLMVVPCYLLLRKRIAAWSAACLALAAIVAGYQQEVYAWGGYTQLLATGFLLFAVYWLGCWLETGSRSQLVLSAVFVSLTAGTSHFVLAQFAAVSVVTVVVLMLTSPDRSRMGRKLTVWALACGAASLVFLPWYTEIVSTMASATTNASSFSMLSFSSYEFVFRENLGLGLGYAVVGAAASVSPIGGPNTRALRPLVIGLIWGPFIVFALTGEIRHFQLIQVGLILSLSFLVSEAENGVKELRFAKPGLQGLLRMAPATLVGAFLVSVALTGHNRLEDATAWYRTIDVPGQAALDFIRSETPEDAIVFAGTSTRGLPYGWWVEGYARRQTFHHVDQNLLLFKTERELAGLADRLTSATTGPGEFAELLSESGISYVLLTPDSTEFEAFLRRVSTSEVFRNGGYRVLRIEALNGSRQ